MQEGDCFVLRFNADASNTASPTSITDSGCQNIVYPDGMTPGAEVGNLVRVIQGVSRGLPPRKITANTATTITWDVPMVINPGDVWIIEEPTWPYTCDTTSFNNANPLAVVTINMPTGNFVDETLLIAGFTVDVNGNESPDGDAPIREDWVFGAEGLSKVAGLVFQMQGTLGVESNAAQPLYLNRPVTVGDVKAYVQAAPTGCGDHVHDLRGRRGLADPDHSRRPDRSGRHAVADRRAYARSRRTRQSPSASRRWAPRFLARTSRSSSTRNAMDQIYKLQPHRTMALQGFDDYGAAAALWGASDTGFTVSGVFRDLADFAVLVLFQKDDPFGHPLFSYLPDGDLTGLVLDFDITWQGIQAWESLKSAWTDWNTLDYSINGVGHNDVKWIGTPGITVTCNTTGRAGASATFTLNMASPQAGDKVTLWYQNQSFISPAIIAGNPTTDQALWWQGSVATTDQALWWQGNAAYNHWVKIGSATYSCLEDSLNSAGVANNIAAQINASDPNCSCTTGGAYGNEIFISLRSGKYGPVAVSSSDGSGGATLSNYQHWVKIGSVTYSCYEGSLNSAQIAANVAAQINASDPNCTATVGGQYNNEILITLKAGVAGPVAVSSSDGSAAASLTPGTNAATILNNIAGQINGTNWVLNGPAVLSAAVVLPNQLVVTAAPGADGNMVAFYQTDNNSSSRLYFTASNWNLSGGSSDNVSWHVKIDFTALGWSNVDKVWWTIAPALPNSQAYQSTEWKVVVTNWTVTSNPAGKRALKVAGPGSVRIEEDSTWVATSGYWEPAPGNDPVNGAFAFWSQGRAIRAAATGASVTIETHCQSTHDIYVGTRLDTKCGIVTATLDRGASVTLDCYYPLATHIPDAAPAVLRRRSRSAQSGDHALGQQEPIEPGLVFLLRFPRMRSEERRARSGGDDHRRRRGNRLRHGRHVQTLATEARLEHPEARAAGRDRSLLRRLLVEAGGGVQSVLPTMHGHVLRDVERSGCRLAARWRLRDRQDGLRRAGQQQHDCAALRQLHQRDLRRCLGLGLRQCPDDHLPFVRKRVAVPRVHGTAGIEYRQRPRGGDRRFARRHVWREVGHRSDADAGAQPGIPRLELGFLRPAQGERHERGLLVLAGTGEPT